MQVFFDKLQESSLGYAALFACIALAFLGLRLISHREKTPWAWVASFLAHAVGFTFWSGTLSLGLPLAYLVGEVFHVAGFFLLIAGAYRVAGHPYRPWNAVFLGVWLVLWAASLALIPSQPLLASVFLKALRSLLFGLSGGFLIFGRTQKVVGTSLAGLGLVVWGLYLLVFAFVPINFYLYFGFLVGFHVLASFGMVALVLDQMRARAEASEQHAKTLEGILPICCYCKNIRDEENHWHRLEEYIEDRSKAEFSHGICPDCFAKHHPDRS